MLSLPTCCGTAFRRLLIGSGLVIVTTLSVQAEADVSGLWAFRVPRGDGTFSEAFFDLKQNGTAVTGNTAGPDAPHLLSGTFSGGELRFTVSFAGRRGPGGEPPPTITVAYDGRAVNDKFALTATGVPGASNPSIGELARTTADAVKPPAKTPLPALHDFADNGLARTPPMGWNSWNKFDVKINDKTVRQVADAMVSSGMSKAGYQYIVIDDTWELGRDSNGNITTNTKFPDMKALADYVHSKGLKIGIYTSPGHKTCERYEGSYGHEEQDARTYAAWGIDYLKYDWCGLDEIYGRNASVEEYQAVYQKMGDALQNTGRPIVFSLCEYGRRDVWKWGAKSGGNLWRTTGDIEDNWTSMDRIGFRQPEIAAYATVGHWNDPDMLEVGNGGMSTDEYRTHMSLWAMLAAPLMAGNDLRDMTADTKSILMNAEVIAIDQDPAGLPLKRLVKEGTSEVYRRTLTDGSIAVGIFNRGEYPAELSVNLTDQLGFAGKKLQVRDLWKHEAAPVTGDWRGTVPRHGVVLLRVSTIR